MIILLSIQLSLFWYMCNRYSEQKLWILPLVMFNESVEVAGEELPRFQFISE
ncbi:MAG: DUF1653 domain-containing protein [Pseudomonadota bacterium]